MATDALTTEKVNQVLAYAALGFGVAGVLMPGALRGAYGMSVSGPEVTYFGRMWGTRTAVLGALAMSAETPTELRRIATCSAAMNGVDALSAASNSGLPARTRVMGALTSGFFAGMAVYSAMNA